MMRKEVLGALLASLYLGVAEGVRFTEHTSQDGSCEPLSPRATFDAMFYIEDSKTKTRQAIPLGTCGHTNIPVSGSVKTIQGKTEVGYSALLGDDMFSIMLTGSLGNSGVGTNIFSKEPDYNADPIFLGELPKNVHGPGVDLSEGGQCGSCRDDACGLTLLMLEPGDKNCGFKKDGVTKWLIPMPSQLDQCMCHGPAEGWDYDISLCTVAEDDASSFQSEWKRVGVCKKKRSGLPEPYSCPDATTLCNESERVLESDSNESAKSKDAEDAKVDVAYF